MKIEEIIMKVTPEFIAHFQDAVNDAGITINSENVTDGLSVDFENAEQASSYINGFTHGMFFEKDSYMRPSSDGLVAFENLKKAWEIVNAEREENAKSAGE